MYLSPFAELICLSFIILVIAQFSPFPKLMFVIQVVGGHEFGMQTRITHFEDLVAHFSPSLKFNI